jgi:hypothetical protein
MSYGLFTVSREDLANPVGLRERLALATGEPAAADHLVAELLKAAGSDPAVSTWHVMPDPTRDAPARWRLEPMGGS